LFYVDRLSRIPENAEKDIDVLFYGSFNERRSAVLDGLRARGLRVEAVFGVFGADLDALIARAKVIINIHFYENGHIEIIRLFDLFANSCAVVSESNLGEPIDADLANALVLVPYDQLVDATEALVRDADRRSRVAAAGFRAFTQRTPKEMLSQLLADSEAPVSQRLTVYCVAHKRYEKIPVLLHSLMCQTFQDFRLVVIHDGEDVKMRSMLERFQGTYSDRFSFFFTDKHYGDYGHSLRSLAIEQCDSKFIMLTNDENYYVPSFLENMFRKIESEDLDLVMCDMVHSHDRPGGRPQGSYNAFVTAPRTNDVDIGCFIVKTDLAKAVGFRDKSFGGDGVFIDDIMNNNLRTVRWGKVDKILFVHN